MRPLAVTASLATAALAGYLLFPMVANKVVDDKAAPAATLSDEAPVARDSAATTVSRKSPPARPQTLTPAVPQKEASDASPAKRPTQLRRKPKELAAQPSTLPAAPTTVPAAYDPAGASKPPREEAPRTAQPARVQPNPLNGRWIDDLSGRRARLSMGREKLGLPCEQGCERVEAPREARVAGVVMKTEKLAADPSQPLEGKVKRGHFAENTPAVYVE